MAAGERHRAGSQAGEKKEPAVWVMIPLSENKRVPLPRGRRKAHLSPSCVLGRVSPPLGSRQREIQGAGVVLKGPGCSPAPSGVSRCLLPPRWGTEMWFLMRDAKVILGL